MVIRFLQTCPSESPDYPFVTGQVISVPAPSPLLLGYLRDGRAEPLKVEDERAVVDEAETPEPVKATRGRRRAR
jgi:hypothetical protein